MRHEAIYALYPNVIKINDDIGAIDKDDNVIEIDEAAVASKAIEIQAEWDAAKQTQIDAKQSAIDKLAKLGLTPDEVKALLG